MYKIVIILWERISNGYGCGWALYIYFLMKLRNQY
ncbi:hypothetical protein SAMN05443661_1011 [Natronobacterium gregoryi]|uniref:Uncharacterized protein n=2 Tax=Natronobacterium gregoryi TaxID=44930 RepID=L0AK12_NATGS|nr:hypothetical protein Natgr_2981 [Natronobacterium gregoryi SP2]SFI49736.1 hypothetical protein SAMN05443661_1011 [Natronobacterium gregoryi]